MYDPDTRPVPRGRTQAQDMNVNPDQEYDRRLSQTGSSTAWSSPVRPNSRGTTLHQHPRMPGKSVDLRDTETLDRVEALHALKILDTPREERYDRVVRLAQNLFDVPMAAINFIDADRQWTKAEVGLDGLTDTPLSDSLCRHTVQQNSTLIATDARADDRFSRSSFILRDPHVRFYAGEPITAPSGDRIGSLCILDTHPREFSAREQEILHELAAWVERELVIQRDLDRAAQVQQMLMPREVPNLPDYELAGQCMPTQDIGGDFFGWQMLSDGNLQLHVADVMGKGIPAALIAASIRAMLLGASQFNSLHGMIHRVAATAESLLSDTQSFVTVFSARLEPGSGKLDYIDAGHGLAYIFGQDGYRKLRPSGLPIGVFPEQNWQVHTTVLAPGETLVVASDGLLDFFPTLEETIEQVVQADLTDRSVDDIVDALMSFAKAQDHPDDVTVVILRRNSRARS